MPLQSRKSTVWAIAAFVFGFLFGALGTWHLIDIANRYVQTRAIDVWFLIFQIWPFAMAVYLVFVGIRKLSIASNGEESTIAKIGWGRVIVGTFLIVSTLVTHYRPDPNGPVLKPSNETQAMAMNATQGFLTLFLPIVGAILTLAGVRRGFKQGKSSDSNVTTASESPSN